MKKHSQKNALYLRNFIFGVEDSLVSTVGLLSGIAIADVPRATIFLAGMVLIFVEAFSMGVGAFLSEQTSEGFLHKEEPQWRKSIVSSIIMWISYFCAGFIPLSPYIVLPVDSAFWVSIILSLITLFFLGLIGGRASHLKVFRHGIKMLIIGGLAIGIGVIVGNIVNTYLTIG